MFVNLTITCAPAGTVMGCEAETPLELVEVVVVVFVTVADAEAPAPLVIDTTWNFMF